MNNQPGTLFYLISMVWMILFAEKEAQIHFPFPYLSFLIFLHDFPSLPLHFLTFSSSSSLLFYPLLLLSSHLRLSSPISSFSLPIISLFLFTAPMTPPRPRDSCHGTLRGHFRLFFLLLLALYRGWHHDSVLIAVANSFLVYYIFFLALFLQHAHTSLSPFPPNSFSFFYLFPSNSIFFSSSSL